MGARPAGYLLVTPCRDEAAFARRTLDSVVSQSVAPTRWVIVDDGSTDATPEILAEYAARHAWIEVLRRSDRGERRVGPGVIDAFYAGLADTDLGEYEFVCKLDLDLDLPPRYFELLIEEMRKDPQLGTVSGKPYVQRPDGGIDPQRCGDEMSVGMTKFYRSECFLEIGGFVNEVMWDGIDCHRCRMHGWAARSLDDEGLRFLHLRPMGSSQTSIWTGRRRHGRGQYFMGTGFLYMTVSALYRTLERPRVFGAIHIWLGWVLACLSRVHRYDDLEFRKFLRRYQWLALLLGKSRTARWLEAEGLRVALRRPDEPFPTVELLAFRLHAITGAQCVTHVLSGLDAGRGGWIVTSNLDHVRRGDEDRGFVELCARTNIAVADGMPLVWAARLQGTPLPERVTGSDLIRSLSAGLASAGRSVFLLGGDPGTADGAAEVLAGEYPGLTVAGTHCPPFGFEDSDEELARIEALLKEAAPDLVYVALGSPKQEHVIDRFRHVLPRAWWIGIGISFSFVTGDVRRAPRWMRNTGLEWVHRLFQEPRRLAGRYLRHGVPFALRLLVWSLSRRGQARIERRRIRSLEPWNRTSTSQLVIGTEREPNGDEEEGGSASRG